MTRFLTVSLFLIAMFFPVYSEVIFPRSCTNYYTLVYISEPMTRIQKHTITTTNWFKAVDEPVPLEEGTVCSTTGSVIQETYINTVVNWYSPDYVMTDDNSTNSLGTVEGTYTIVDGVRVFTEKSLTETDSASTGTGK